MTENYPCPVCSAPTQDGLLCRRAREGYDTRPPCTAVLRAAFSNLPWMLRELQVTLTRQNQATKSGGRGNGETPLPFNVNASEVAWTVTNTIGTWIRTLDEQANPGPTMTDWCAWLLDRMPAIRRHVAVVQMFEEINYSVGIVRQAIDRPADREYVQQCPVCDKGIYAPSAADFATCDECRRVAERDEDGRIIEALPEYSVAAAHVARVARLRAAVLPTDLLRTATEDIRGQQLSIKLVRSWINRGRLKPKTYDGDVPLYAVEDALALAAQIPIRESIKDPAPRRVVRRVGA